MSMTYDVVSSLPAAVCGTDSVLPLTHCRQGLGAKWADFPDAFKYFIIGLCEL